MHNSQIVILISSIHMHHGSRFESRFSYHPHGHLRACVLFALTFSFYLLLFLPSLFLFLFLFLTNKKFMANLYNSAKEGGHQRRPLLPPHIKLLLPRVQESLDTKLECREIHERMRVFWETFLIVNMLDEILKSYATFQKFWQHHQESLMMCEEPFQSIHLLVFSVRARKSVDDN